MNSTRSVWGVPLAVWVLSGVFFAAAAHMTGQAAWSPETWAHWDSWQYLSIAQDGYKIWQEPRMAQGRIVLWKGNAAWFPLYPWVVRALTSLGMNAFIAARVIAEVFWFLSLAVLWNLYLKKSKDGWVAMILAAVFPGAIYYHAIFPTSMALFFMFLYLYALPQKRFKVAFLCGFAAGASYTSALYLAGVALAWGMLEREDKDLHRPSFVLAALAPALGAAMVFGVQFIQLKSWAAFFRIWEFHRYNGWSMIRLKQMIYIPTISHPTAFTKVLVIAQSLSILFAILAVVRRGVRTSEERLLGVMILLFWIAPHLSPYRLSWYRAEALLLPIVVLLSRFSRRWQWAIVAIWTPMAWLMALQFFRDILV